MRTIATPQGDVTLRNVDQALFDRLKTALPFGIVGMKSEHYAMEFGLVMQRGEEELVGIKLQPPDGRRDEAERAMEVNILLTAAALPRYLCKGHGGVLIPFPYLRDKGDRCEAGIALFIYPQNAGAATEAPSPFADAYDRQLGRGCTAMLSDFVDALKESARETGLPFYSVIGMEMRPRLALGALSFGYLVTGSQLVALKRTIVDNDVTWGILRGAGVEEVFHLPATAVALGGVSR